MLAERKIKEKKMFLARYITRNKQVMDALRDSEKKYHTLFKNSLVGLFRSRVNDGKILECNDRFAHIFGYRDSETCCAEYLSSYHYLDNRIREALVKKIKQTGEINNFELRSRRIDNSTIWIRYTAYLNQEQDCFEGVLTDITEEKIALHELEKSHDELEKTVKKRTADLLKMNKKLIWEIEERKDMEHALQHQFQLQKIITALSTEFINLTPDEIDDGIMRALKMIGEFIDADRSYVFLFYDNLTRMNNTHEWCADGIKPEIHNCQGFFVKDFPWCEAIINRFETIHIPRVADLPPDAIEKEVFQSQHIQSLVLIPMTYCKSLYGFIGLDSVRTEKAWPDYIIVLLEIVGNIFANALERRCTERILRKSKNKLRHLSCQLIEAQEKDRKRISSELHDNVGQSIATIKFALELFLRQTGQSTENLKVESLEKAVLMARQTIQEVRKIQMDLRPSLLDEMGIASSISWFCRKFKKIYKNISIEQHISLKEEDVPPPLKVVIFRVVQEALNNVGKHAEADRMWISLQATDVRIELAIEDNGVGFDVEKASSCHGFGLMSMKERVKFSGGFFSIESKKGSGTVVQASW
jgi:PAS domain S-box-containing protein